MPVEEFIFMIWLLLGFGYFGGTVKIIDKVVDEGFELERRVILFLIFSCGIYAGLAMVFDQMTAAVGLSLIIGVLLAGKMDAYEFALVTIIEITIFVIGKNVELISYIWNIIPLVIMLTIAAVIDELLDTFLDSRFTDQKKNVILYNLLKQRPVLKAFVLVLPLIDPRFTLFYSVCVWFFDVVYSLVGRAIKPAENELIDRKI